MGGHIEVIDQQRLRAPHTRSALVDNMKAVLIALVVIGHFALEYLPDSERATYVYIWIYLFHMPAFALCSGLVIKDPQRSASRAISTLLPMYIGFSVLHVAMRRLLVTDSWEWEILIAPGVHWYLLSLLAWRLVLPVMLRLRTPLITSIALSLLAGLFDRVDTTLSISRTIVFLPFFLAGYLLGIEGLERIRKTPRILAVGGLAIVTGLTVWFYGSSGLGTAALAGSRSYAEADVSILLGITGRIAMFVATIAAVVMIVQLIPERRVGWTVIGERTMTIYLLHMYGVYAFRHAMPRLEDTGWYEIAGVVAALVTIAVTQLKVVDTAARLYDRAWQSAFGLLVKPSDSPKTAV